MGFSGHASRVRDTSLPRSHRLSALGSCLQHTQAMDYLVAWSYLEHRVGHARRAPEFPLLAALAAVEDERRLRALAEAAYAEHRRRQKRLGLRHPRLAEVTPSSPRRWFGDEVRAARHVLGSGADVPAAGADLPSLLLRARRRREGPALRVLEQLHLATYGGLPVGVDWGFTPSGLL